MEVFGQAVPVERQRGYRHLLVERRLLKLGGEALADRVRAHRTQHGGSLEPAFAATLRLDGDPYEAVLALEVDDDAQLRRLVSTAVGR